jgi:hypothetical protein
MTIFERFDDVVEDLALKTRVDYLTSVDLRGFKGMGRYPVRIPTIAYSGSNSRRRWTVDAQNALAQRIEAYINHRVEQQEQEFYSFTYASIAQEFGTTTEKVRRILLPVDGGHNGLTIHRPEFAMK